MTKVLLIAFDQIMSPGLRTLLGQAPSINLAGEVTNISEAIDAVVRLTPDVVLIGTLTPGKGGIETCRTILATGLPIHVVFVTAKKHEEMIVPALLAGAHGFLLEDTPGEHLIAAIKLVAAGESILHPLATRAMTNHLQRLASLKVKHGTATPLSAQQKQVLALVADGNTNKEIAAQLHLSDKTVKNYLHNIFRKLGASHRSEAAVIYSKLSKT